jgi:hypothetical protein
MGPEVLPESQRGSWQKKIKIKPPYVEIGDLWEM